MRSTYSLPSTSQIRAPRPLRMNCGYPGGSGPAFWCPYMPPGMTARALARSSWSAERGRKVSCGSVRSWARSVIFSCPFRYFCSHGLLPRGKPRADAGCGFRVNGAEKAEYVIQAGDPGVGTQPGGDQRPAGGPEPGGVDRAAAEQQPGDHPGVEGVAAAGGVDHLDVVGRDVLWHGPWAGRDQGPVSAEGHRDAAGAQGQHVPDGLGQVVAAGQPAQLVLVRAEPVRGS